LNVPFHEQGRPSDAKSSPSNEPSDDGQTLAAATEGTPEQIPEKTSGFGVRSGHQAPPEPKLSPPHLAGSYLDSLKHHQAQIFARWEREDATNDSLQSIRDCVAFFKRPPYRISGIKRLPLEAPRGSSPASSESLSSPVPGTVMGPASDWLWSQLQIPVVERLLAARARPEPPTHSRTGTTPERWEAFLLRQSSLEDDKRRREWGVRQKPPRKTREGLVFRKLYEESLLEPRTTNPPSPRPVRSPGRPQPPAFIEEGSRPPRPLRACVTEPDKSETRGFLFGAASQELVKDKPSFKQRCEATWDLKAVLAEQRAQEIETKNRREFYAEFDQ
jgi:hypothetical protein